MNDLPKINRPAGTKKLAAVTKMIHNGQQLHITKTQAEKFRRALEDFDDNPEAHPGVHPKLINAQHEAIVSQL